MPKVLIVGFDGATWDIITPLVEQGALPTFKNLIEKGTYGYMESTIPPLSLPAWISMFSGLTPEQLCMFDFTRVTVKDNIMDARLLSSHDTKGKLLWDLLSKKKTKSLVLNLPGIYPPYPVEGHLIGLDFTPLESTTYPENLEKILVEEHDLNSMKNARKMFYKGEEAALQAIETEEKKILEIVTSFSSRFSYDVIFVRFGIPDHVSHHSIRDEEMKKFHLLMDSILEELIECIEFDYLFLVSDHGIKKDDTVFYINKFLEELGVYKISLTDHLSSQFSSVLSDLIGERIVLMLHKKLKGLDIGQGPSGQKKNLGETTVFGYSTMPHSFCPLYSTTHSDTDKIIELLKTSPYITAVHPVKCEGGPFAIAESSCTISTRFSTEKVEKNVDWIHDTKGIFLAYGKNIKKGHTLNCTLYDITPTVLHTLQFPIPENITGNILTDIFEQGAPAQERAPHYVPSEYYSGENEKEKIKDTVEKLKTLEKV